MKNMMINIFMFNFIVIDRDRETSKPVKNITVKKPAQSANFGDLIEKQQKNKVYLE